MRARVRRWQVSASTRKAGKTSSKLAVRPIDNRGTEPTETVVVTLTPGASYSIGAPASATVNILDNDQPPVDKPAELLPSIDGEAMLLADMAHSDTRPPLSDKEQAALLKLLADEDPAAIRLLEEAFLAKGAESVRVLGQLSAEAPPAARRNAEAILLAVQRQSARERFARFCATGSDLEEGVFLLAHTRYPTFAREKYTQQLDELAETLRPKVDLENPKETVEEITRLLFGVVGFRGNTENYYDPDNSLINRVLDRRVGIPITLSAVYLLVARRLDIPLVGVGLPGHFILKWNHHSVAKADEHFVDPFNQGRIVTKKECVSFLTRNGHEFSDDMLAAVTDRQMLARMCNNLVTIYQQTGEPQRAGQYENFAALLSGSP